MGITIADIKSHILARKQQVLQVGRIELGQGIYIEAENGALYICDSTDRAKCGLVEETPIGDIWILYREWHTELTAEFGTLPAQLVIDGEEEAA